MGVRISPRAPTKNTKPLNWGFFVLIIPPKQCYNATTLTRSIMFISPTSPGLVYNDTISTTDPTRSHQIQTRSIAYDHKNLPINPHFACTLDTSDIHLVGSTTHSDAAFPIHIIHFMDEKGHGIHRWEYASEKTRDTDFNNLLTKI